MNIYSCDAPAAITDSAGFAECRKLVLAPIAAFRGRFLTRGGATEVLEGGWNPSRLVVLEFPDVATLKARYYSPEYQSLLELRKRTAHLGFRHRRRRVTRIRSM